MSQAYNYNFVSTRARAHTHTHTHYIFVFNPPHSTLPHPPPPHPPQNNKDLKKIFLHEWIGLNLTFVCLFPVSVYIIIIINIPHLSSPPRFPWWCVYLYNHYFYVAHWLQSSDLHCYSAKKKKKKKKTQPVFSRGSARFAWERTQAHCLPTGTRISLFPHSVLHNNPNVGPSWGFNFYIDSIMECVSERFKVDSTCESSSKQSWRRRSWKVRRPCRQRVEVTIPHAQSLNNDWLWNEQKTAATAACTP